MGFFGPTRSERLTAAGRALRPYGFVLDPSAATGLRKYEPFEVFARPEEYVVGTVGTIEGAQVEAYEYEYTTRNSDGNTTCHRALVVALHHSWVRGGASFVPDYKQWGGIAAALDVLFWIPPFTLLKAFQLIMEARTVDRIVGNDEFDRLYLVRAASDEAAQRAITEPLRELCLRLRFRGAVEMRPGVLLYAPYDYGLDEKTAVTALGVGTAFLGALAPRRGHPMR